jgi:hypothetical protein
MTAVQYFDEEETHLADLDRLQVTLLALLPKDGTPVTVAALACDAGTEQGYVIHALIAPFMKGDVIFDVRADAYSARRGENDLPTERKTTRQSKK